MNENEPDRWEALSELVHDTASQAASTANNDGEAAQISYLMEHGWDRDEIEHRLGQMVAVDITHHA